MTSTERKLDEARYFFSQLLVDDPYFDYILSAYLNAARSTTWIMRYEFSKKEGWEEWFANREVSVDQKGILKKINDLRILSTKQEGIKTNYFFLDEMLIDEQYYPIIKESLKNDGEFVLTIRSLDEVEKELEDNDKFTGRFVFEGRIDRTIDRTLNSRKDIYELCREYFNFLHSQVEGCVNKFG
jgi:hypothetical protein